jgi:hypothetical protein
MKNSQRTFTSSRNKQEFDQVQLDSLAIGLSQIFGAKVVRQEEYEKLSKTKNELDAKSKESDVQNFTLLINNLKLDSYFKAFKEYHTKWKPITRKIEKRSTQLAREKLLINLDEESYPLDVRKNLREAYNCYGSGLNMACYIMILRSTELMINHIYKKYEKEDEKYVSASTKFKYLKRKGVFDGADSFVLKAFIEARNQVIHEVYEPTDRKILSAFETVIDLLDKYSKIG